MARPTGHQSGPSRMLRCGAGCVTRDRRPTHLSPRDERVSGDRAVMESTVDALIVSSDRGDRSAAHTLFATLYAELHRLARRELARQDASLKLGATTLLHEAYLAMADRDGAVFPDRARFMAYAARVMRGLIIDEVRANHAQKRGGGVPLTTLNTDVAERLTDVQSLVRISDALDELATHDPALAEIVDLKFFCG